MVRCFFLLALLVILAVGCSVQNPQSDSTTFDVVITAVGENKIIAIKAVRQVSGLGLKDAKDLVEGAPATVKSSVSKAEAESVAKILRDSDLAVEIRPHDADTTTR